MSDHKEKDTEYKKRRGLSRRAQLRRQHKHIKHLELMISQVLWNQDKLIKENKELYQRLCETQKLVPFWIRKFP
jgi:uncharacterized protein YktB (UPF0637 family)